MRTVIVILFCAVLVPSPTLEGQARLPVAPGDRVRLATDQVRGEFTVVAVAGEDMTVRRSAGSGLIPVALRDLDFLSVDRGLQSRSVAAGKGGQIGALVGGLVGLAVGLANRDESCGGGWCAEPGEEDGIALTAVGFAAAGAGVGALIGALFPGRRWEVFTLPLVVGLEPDVARGPGFTASLRL